MTNINRRIKKLERAVEQEFVSEKEKTLIGLPLWRLLVALADAERSFGANSVEAKELAFVVHQKLNIRTPI